MVGEIEIGRAVGEREREAIIGRETGAEAKHRKFGGIVQSFELSVNNCSGRSCGTSRIGGRARGGRKVSYNR